MQKKIRWRICLFTIAAALLSTTLSENYSEAQTITTVTTTETVQAAPAFAVVNYATVGERMQQRQSNRQFRWNNLTANYQARRTSNRMARNTAFVSSTFPTDSYFEYGTPAVIESWSTPVTFRAFAPLRTRSVFPSAVITTDEFYVCPRCGRVHAQSIVPDASLAPLEAIPALDLNEGQ